MCFVVAPVGVASSIGVTLEYVAVGSTDSEPELDGKSLL